MTYLTSFKMITNYRIGASITLLFAFSLFAQIAAGGTTSALPFSLAKTAAAQSNPIVAENSLPGTTDWQITQLGNDYSQHIKGYASKTSVNLNETIDFFVHVRTSQTYTLDVYRMGWYNGDGGRLMTQIGPLQGTPQTITTAPPAGLTIIPAAPAVNHQNLLLDEGTGKITAPWDVAHTLLIPSTWTSGIYLAKLTATATGHQNYIKFVVRDDARTADFVYQHADTTDQAYNRFPVDYTSGKSLYSGWGTNTMRGNPIAWKVSFDRPYSGDGSGLFFKWEEPLMRWLEQSGYDVTYVSDLDTHLIGTAANSLNLANYKGFLSTGHDEYWSREMFDNVEAARDNGVNLAFFGSNAVYWQVRFEDGNRTMVSAKNDAPMLESGLPAAQRTRRFREVGTPEQALIGTQYVTFNGAALNDPTLYTDYIVQNSSHWVYSNTGFADGDTVAGLTGYEIDKDFGVTPSSLVPGSYKFLSNSPFTNDKNPPQTYNANSSVYQATSGAWVFGSGTMNWSWGLDRTGYVDARIQQTTANVLNTFRTGQLPASAPTCGLINEAEDGVISVDPGGNPFVIGTDTAASGGQYIHVQGTGANEWAGPNMDRRVDYCFGVTQPGIYRIRAEVYGDTVNDDSFYAQVNGAPAAGYVWDTKPYNYGTFNTDYETDYVNDRNSVFGDIVEVALGVGDHTFSVFVREDDTRLDSIALERIDTAPAQLLQIAPDSTNEPSAPAFSWESDPQATDYRLVIYSVQGDAVAFDQTYSAIEANCAGGGTCAISPASLSLAAGNYTWLIRGLHSVNSVDGVQSYPDGPWSVD